MRISNNVSDETADALAELLFCALPGVEPREIIAFLNCILRIAEREVRRAKREEGERWTRRSNN